jgi:hypothetical protein
MRKLRMGFHDMAAGVVRSIYVGMYQERYGRPRNCAPERPRQLPLRRTGGVPQRTRAMEPKSKHKQRQHARSHLSGAPHAVGAFHSRVRRAARTNRSARPRKSH